MAKTKNQRNGRLEEAMAALVQAQAMLVQNQAAFTQTQTAFVAQMQEHQRQLAELQRINTQRFERIETILLEHSRVLRELPDAVREKIGFKPS